ncbi:hypothetical protein Nepgr_006232 [Nepenthes gracilis]|uniref:FHA domain-containing protein n=1 Tax=Nepenthes gracilis TaxID=150966 RepID=A0AAD3XH70_NEPGR|nr:hypothetical protein Nepgr_006232 [Nepenthes gracilis]
MATSMGPPPPSRPPSSSGSEAAAPTIEPQPPSQDEDSSAPSSETPTITKSVMAPPPAKNSNLSEPDPSLSHTDPLPAEQQLDSTPSETPLDDHRKRPQDLTIPYTIPPWNEAPSHPYYLEVLKDGSIIDQLEVTKKGAYLFGRVDICDFVLEHPTISRFHAVLQFKGNEDVYLYDLGSTHGTFINKKQVKKNVYVDLHVGDVLRFGHSSRLYIFQGPAELMPPENDAKSIRYAKLQQEMQDRGASLRRAREEATFADGISWGMREDAIEEAEDDTDEITWQAYKGELTEKQEKTRSKVLKRMEKIAHMKKEIDAIRVKDISQGGLTQGQQTQIARNEQRISQIMEELESLEETLNDSIRESIGARGRKISGGKKKGATEDEDDFLSDEDEFYDRTKKGNHERNGRKRQILLDEKNRMSEPEVESETGDTLDAYITGLSSQLVVDRTIQLEKELSSLQIELDRILYLLKVADPTGEVTKKRATTAQGLKPEDSKKRPATDKNRIRPPEKPSNGSIAGKVTPNVNEVSKAPEASENVADAVEEKSIVYAPVKPQWLGAVKDSERTESQQQESMLDAHEGDQFIDYKDRKNALGNVEDSQVKSETMGLENAAPGLIIRKKKQVGKPESGDNKQPLALSAGAEMMAEDAVALLLKHERGYYSIDESSTLDDQVVSGQDHLGRDHKKLKRMFGPEKPMFLDGNSDYESWVPPEGQSGDGRTSLNDRFGY